MARRRKIPPKKMTKRRLLRVIYRRGRIYVPVLALLLLAMAITLPISPPGLPGYIGRTIEARTGLPVSIESVRLRVIAGEVTLRGIQLRDVNGGEAFQVGEVHLTGDFGELIAGNGRWPAEVIIDNPSEMVFRHRDGRLEPRGALATLIEALSRADFEDPDDEDEDTSALAALDRPTPAITIRNVHAFMRSDDPRLAGTRVSLQLIHVPQRIGSGDLIQANFNGIATAGLSEDFSGSVTYSPGDEQAAVELRLDGIKRDVTIQGFGNVHMAARGIEMNATALHLGDGKWQMALDQEFERFEISEMRTGGERWIEQDLKVRARGVWETQENRVKEASLSIGGEEIDLAVSGLMQLGDDHDGLANLRIRRFPAPLIALGQRLARDEGFTVSREADARVLLDVAIEGPFARPGEMDVDGKVDIIGWSFQRTGWPTAIMVHEARGDITNSTLEISNLRLSSGTLEASGSLTAPVAIPWGETRPGSLELTLQGTPETAFDFLRAHDITNTVVTAATVPLTINLRTDFQMGRREDLLEPVLDTDSLSMRGDISWGRGTLLADVISGTITVQPGGLRFNDSGATLESLSISRDEIAVSLTGRVDLTEPRVFASPAYIIALSVSGPIREMVTIASSHLALPQEVQTLGGAIDLGGSLRGTFAEGQYPAYELKARVTNGEGIATFQVNPVRFTGVDAEIDLNNERISVSRLNTRLQDDTTGQITAEIDRLGARATVLVDTTLETVVHVLPRELDDMVMAGKARADGEVRVEVNKTLPEAPDVVMAWMGAFANPQEYRFHVLEDSPLRLRINAELTPLEPVTLFHRDFPEQVDNIRGVVRADELGFILESIASRWGDAEDVIVSGRVTLGHVGPLSVTFEAIAPDLDLNDWIDGWGDREWATAPRLGRDERQARRDQAAAQAPPGPRAPRLRTKVTGRLHLKRTEFLTVRAEDMVGQLEYEAWEGADNKLHVNVEDSIAYGGTLKSTATILFPSGELPRIRASVDAVEVGVNGFMADLRKDEEQTVGLFTGKATLEGLLVDYSTWVGGGEYVITDSKFIGEQVLIVLSRAMRLGFEQTQANTIWRGTGTFRDEIVYLPDMKISSNEFNLVSDGTIGFNGALDFRIAVEFLGNRIEWIPLFGRVAPLVNRFTDFLLSFKLEGTVYEPRVRAVPFSMPNGLSFGRTAPGEAP